MEIPLLQDIVIIFGLSAVVIFLFHRLKIPPIIGFLVTGIIIGPTGILSSSLSVEIIKNNHHEIDHLAEIGVILLLFTIGIEFSIKNLIQIRRTVLLGGSLQVGLSIALSYFVASWFGYGFGEAIFMGFLVALSSTAIVLRTLQKNNDIGSPTGKASLGILIFQDLIIVPMMLFIPILAGNTGNVGLSLLYLVLKTAGLILFTYVASRWIIPKALHAIAKTGSRELFLLALLLFGFGVAWLTSFMGLSLALGAFLAGLAISESEYSHHAFGNVIPFRDIFTAFFFVSVGMLLDINFLINEPAMVLIFVFFVLFIKTIVSGFATFVLGYPFRATVIVGLTLSQIGEFSFVLSEIGLKNGFLISSTSGDYYYQLFLSVTTVTMILTPFIIMSAPWISKTITSILPIPERYIKGIRKVNETIPEELDNHVVIVGMGLNGSNIAHASSRSNIKHVIIENDADIVEKYTKLGEPLIYGDATFESVLEKAKIEKALVLVIVIEDPASIYTIIKQARELNPNIYIISRTRYLADVDDLYKAGANEVIPEEFETSIEIFSRVLNKYLVPQKEILELTADFRSKGYEKLRFDKEEGKDIGDLKLHIPDIEISSVIVAEESEIVNKTLEESEIRQRYQVSVLAVLRGDQTISNPNKDFIVKKDDILYLMGNHKECTCVYSYLKGLDDEECKK